VDATQPQHASGDAAAGERGALIVAGLAPASFLSPDAIEEYGDHKRTPAGGTRKRNQRAGLVFAAACR